MIRDFVEQDYAMYSKWLLKRCRPVPTYKSLPKEGYVCNNCVAGFIQECGDSVIFCNFASSWDEAKRSDSVDELLDFLIKKYKESGFSYILMGTTIQKLKDRLAYRGFVVLEENVTHMGLKCL